MKTCQFMLFLLFALQIVCLSAQTRLKRFEIITKEVSQFSISVEHPDCAVLSVYSAISGLQFESNMGKIKAYEHRPTESRYVIFLYPVKQKISVKCPGYIESEFPIFSNLIAKQQVSYEVNEAFDTQGKGDFTLSSDPSGAAITIDQIPVFKELTPYEFKQFGAQSYGIRLSKERYETLSANIAIEAGKAKSQTIKLKPLWADLTILSEPSGSSVYLNNVLKGVTPLAFTGVAKGLDAGEYELRIQPASQFYEAHSQKMVLTGNTAQEINHKHTDISGMISLIPSHRPIEVILNSERDTELSKDFTKRLVAGEYNLKVLYSGEHKSAFDPFVQNIKLKATDVLSIPVNFNPRQYKLILNANVQDYTLSLLDVETGKTTQYTNLQQIPSLYAGAYSLSAIKPGYRIINQEIMLIDKDISLNIQLEELSKIYNNKIGKWKVNKYSSATLTLVSLAASAYFSYNSMQNYDNYQKATTTSSAMDFRGKAIDNRNIAYGTIGIDALGLSWWLFSYLKQHHWQKKLHTEMGKN